MPIRKIILPTQIEEFTWIAKEIRRLIDTGVKPYEIAIISRKHDILKAALPILQFYDVPVYYELGQNIFERPRIQELVTMIRFVDSLVRKIQPEADNYLVDIVSYSFWELDPQSVWELSVYASKQHQTWLEAMLNSAEFIKKKIDASKLIAMATFFIELGTQAKSEAAETIFDMLLGVSALSGPDTTEEETEQNIAITDSRSSNFVSPFKRYYFDQPLNESIHRFEKKSTHYNYLTFLSNLRVLVQAMRGHSHSPSFHIRDLVDFLDLLEKNNIQLIDNSPYDKDLHCVNLLTTHKAKGMEFDHVFVLSCTQNVWIGKNKGQKLSFPSNLSLSPDNDILDDKLRLFFVAITRAKTNLYLTAFSTAENGKEVEKLSFLDGEWEKVEYDTTTKETILQVYLDADGSRYLEWSDQQKSLILGVLENYKLSVTHLNNFLDVTLGGPRYFVETNLLRFPQAKSVSASYGTAIHAAIRGLYAEYKKSKSLPPCGILLYEFAESLKKERLSDRDFKNRLKSGEEKLRLYYEQQKNLFEMDSVLEYNFNSQAVRLGEAEITGQIDKMDKDDVKGNIVVTDFKTGKVAYDWKGDTLHDKIKLWKYEQQLHYYKLLVENSRDLASRYKVNVGRLEFIEADSQGSIICLERVLDTEMTLSLNSLIQVVYGKIMNLDFPDTSGYPQNLDGILQFTQDLLENKV